MDNILFLMNGEHAVEVHTKKFDKEADLQKIIRDNPDLLVRSIKNGECRTSQ